MQASSHPKLSKRWIYCTVLLALFLFCSVNLANASTITESNANGTFQVTSTTRFCTDPDSGLNVGYIIYSGFTWTQNGVSHLFPIGTTFNSSNGRGADGGVLCGPDDVSTGSGYAIDGSGFFMVVGGYDNPTIYDPNGNIVFKPNPPCFC